MLNLRRCVVGVVAVILVSIITTGCVQPFLRALTLTDFTTGEMAKGTFTASRNAEITLTNGDHFTGQWSQVQNAAFTFGLTGEVTVSPGFVGVGGDQVYALLKSDEGVLMEVIVNSGAGAGGVGEARTNDGRVYRVQF